MSIRNKLLLFMLTLLAAVAAVLTLLFFYNERSAIASNNQRKNFQILLAMSEVCREIHDTPGKSSAYRYFKAFLKTPEIIKVSCSDRRGRTFMEDRYYNPYPHPFSNLFKTFPPPQTGVWETKNDNGVEILQASLKARSVKGGAITAHVDFSTQLISQEMDSSLRQTSARFFIILSLAFAAGCIGILIITRVVVKPIQLMAEAARMIGSGRLGHRIPAAGGDEMGMLASEFNEMADKLKELDEMKKDFVSSITHDLRSPVTGIELCADLIKELAEKHEYNKIPEQLFSINEHSQRLNRFIDSLLEISKIESGKTTLDIKAVNLEELSDRAVRALKPYAGQKGIKMELVVGQTISDTRGDPDRLYQVLANIIGNAVKFTNSGSVGVYITTAPGWQQIRVCDTGIGIPEHEIKNLFSKFYRINSDSRGYPSSRQGTGLGLFIAKFIIEQHGGRIEAKSSPGKGSEFTIFFPT
ncbi:MAG: HAMP domain-containing histidine kinase [Elusimicrobia bacterium]|nr:HAMP domain-containing histidine kinase [Elusimicrobiota bacterium]